MPERPEQHPDQSDVVFADQVVGDMLNVAAYLLPPYRTRIAYAREALATISTKAKLWDELQAQKAPELKANERIGSAPPPEGYDTWLRLMIEEWKTCSQGRRTWEDFNLERSCTGELDELLTRMRTAEAKAAKWDELQARKPTP